MLSFIARGTGLWSTPILIGVLMCSAAVPKAMAQCQAQWSIAIPGYNGQVTALANVPSGYVVAGTFMVAGVSENQIARWDGSALSPLGTFLNGSAYSLVTLPNGDLVAAGSLLVVGGVNVHRIARWDGTAWSALGSGMNNGPAAALTVLPNGDLVVGGALQWPAA